MIKNISLSIIMFFTGALSFYLIFEDQNTVTVKSGFVEPTNQKNNNNENIFITDADQISGDSSPIKEIQEQSLSPDQSAINEDTITQLSTENEELKSTINDMKTQEIMAWVEELNSGMGIQAHAVNSFANEEVNHEWSIAQEEKIQDLLLEDSLANYQVTASECRTRTCRISFLSSSTGEFNALISELTEQYKIRYGVEPIVISLGDENQGAGEIFISEDKDAFGLPDLI